MKLQSLALQIGLTSLLMSCQSVTQRPQEPYSLSIREQIKTESTISVKSDIQSVEYVPLETTDSCFISNALCLQCTGKYIILYNGKTNQIMQFDRKGKYLGLISKAGNGPGEYGIVNELFADEKDDKLYVFQQGGAPLIFSLEGKFLKSDSTLQKASDLYFLKDGKKVLKGLIMSPIQIAPWIAAVQDGKGNILYSKNPYPAGLDPTKSFMRDIYFTPSAESALVYTSCNDTIFRLSSNGISPAYILQRKNGPDFNKNIADVSQFQTFQESDVTIHVYDFFETPHYFYLRIQKGKDFYIQQFDKATGTLLSHKIPDIFIKSSKMIPGDDVAGLENDYDNGVPFWPEFGIDGKSRAQILSPYQINSLRSKGILKQLPAKLILPDEVNPVIAIYTFKE